MCWSCPWIMNSCLNQTSSPHGKSSSPLSTSLSISFSLSSFISSVSLSSLCLLSSWGTWMSLVFFNVGWEEICSQWAGCLTNTVTGLAVDFQRGKPSFSQLNQVQVLVVSWLKSCLSVFFIYISFHWSSDNNNGNSKSKLILQNLKLVMWLDQREKVMYAAFIHWNASLVLYCHWFYTCALENKEAWNCCSCFSSWRIFTSFLRFSVSNLWTWCSSLKSSPSFK